MGSGFDQDHHVLLGAFKAWAGESADPDGARLALDYKDAIGDPYPTHWVHDDIDDLLLGYLPDRVVLEEDETDGVLDSIARFFEFLGAEGFMHQGSDSAPDLVEHVHDHREEFREMMVDPESGGQAGRLVRAMRADGVALDDDKAVELWLEEFNAGSLARREAILGPAPDYDELYDEDLYDTPGIDLPPRPPVDEDLARASAAESPLLEKIRALADYLGKGRALTAKGNLKLADARELVELLETPDTTDYEIAGKQRSFRTATELLWLDMIVWLAQQVGAVRVQKNRMSAVKAWRPRGEGYPLEAASELAFILVDEGPLTILYDDRRPFDGPRAVVDASAVAHLAGLYEGDRSFEDTVTALAGSMPAMVRVPDWYYGPDGDLSYLEESVRRDMAKEIRLLEWAGLVHWTGHHLEPDRWSISEHRRGGIVSLTPFGHWFVQGPLTKERLVSAPIVIPFTATLDDPPEEIVAALARSMGAGPVALADAWRQLGGYEGLPEQLWRVESPDTAPLLEALGRLLGDRATAKAARKAHLKHQSWMAGR